MKKLFLRVDPQGNILNGEEFNNAVDHFYNLTHREMAIRDKPQVSERLRAWTELAREAGFKDFDANALYEANVRLGDNTYSQKSFLANSSLLPTIDVEPPKASEYKSTRSRTDRYELHHFPMSGFEKGVQYGFLKIRREVNAGYAKKIPESEEAAYSGSDLIAITTITDEAWTNLENDEMLDRAASSITALQEFCSHDYLHYCTTFDTNFDGDAKTPQIVRGLQTDGNRRGTYQGYENFVTLQNQKIFFKLREDKSPWFEGLVKEVENFAKLLTDIKDPKTREVVRSIGAAHLYNGYVPKKLLVETPPEKWGEILRTVQPKELSNNLTYQGKTCSLEEISMEFYSAAKTDYRDRLAKIKEAAPTPDITPASAKVKQVHEQNPQHDNFRSLA